MWKIIVFIKEELQITNPFNLKFKRGGQYDEK